MIGGELGTVGTWPHRVGVLLAAQPRRAEAVADLDPLDRVDAQQRRGDIGSELAVDRRAETGRGALGHHAIDYAQFDLAEIGNNPFFCPDPVAAAEWEALVDETRKAGSSIGAQVVVEATGVPPGWGAPIYAKLDSELAAAMMGINAVKGVEIGDGFAAALVTGEANADPMRPGRGEGESPQFLANHAGGIAGGISTGQPVRCRVAFKPTSSILTPVPSITSAGEATEVRTKGRHDPCVGIRGVPVAEAMMALVLADQKLLHRAQCG